MTSAIRMLVTDMDGTLVGTGAPDEDPATFGEALSHFAPGVKWVIVTGRSLADVQRKMEPFSALSLYPDAVIAHSFHVYTRGNKQYIPHHLLNIRILGVLLWRLFYSYFRLLRWVGHVRHARRTRVLKQSRHFLHVKFTKDSEALAALEEAQTALAPYHFYAPVLHKNRMEFHLRPVLKGVALDLMCRHEHVDPAGVLAIGDGRSDLSLLAPQVSGGGCGCPANAAAELKQAVHEWGGHLAQASGLAGLVEILRAYQEGRVSSALPEDWQRPVARLRNPHGSTSHMTHWQVTPRLALTVLMVLYLIVLAFAQFRLIPFSDKLSWPLRWLANLFDK
jgi:HAD superfamily hydrolase (TIGR01484 family)